MLNDEDWTKVRLYKTSNGADQKVFNRMVLNTNNIGAFEACVENANIFTSKSTIGTTINQGIFLGAARLRNIIFYVMRVGET